MGYELFAASVGELDRWFEEVGADTPSPAGWYFRQDEGGGLPDGPPHGPFPSRAAAWAALEAEMALAGL